MNENTKKALQGALTAIQDLTAAVVRDVGVAEASRILDALEKAKNALENDETIV